MTPMSYATRAPMTPPMSAMPPIRYDERADDDAMPSH